MGPRRIVCLTEEPTEVLYALGEQDRIVGISGFTVRPPRARKEKPKVSAFTSAKIDEILELQPDFVIGFSDIQADIARELIKRRHRGVDQQPSHRRRRSSSTSAASARWSAPRTRRTRLPIARSVISTTCATRRRRLPRRPKVYFEEWDDPPITGIRWVAELIRIAGGDDMFPERAAKSLARDRILADPRSHPPRARHHHRLMVRQEIPAGAKSPRATAGDRFPPCVTANCTK